MNTLALELVWQFVKKIVENHKGFIFAKGKINVGATFTIYIPEDIG